MKKSISIFVTSLAVLLSMLLLPSMHAGELSRGAMLSASCESCHGTDGRSPGSVPDISGKSAEYIQLALEDYRSGERQSTVMGRHAKGYTDDEILLIAEYFVQQK